MARPPRATRPPPPPATPEPEYILVANKAMIAVNNADELETHVQEIGRFLRDHPTNDEAAEWIEQEHGAGRHAELTQHFEWDTSRVMRRIHAGQVAALRSMVRSINVETGEPQREFIGIVGEHRGLAMHYHSRSEFVGNAELQRAAYRQATKRINSILQNLRDDYHDLADLMTIVDRWSEELRELAERL